MKKLHLTSRFHQHMSMAFAVVNGAIAVATLPFFFMIPVYIPGYVLLYYYFAGADPKGMPIPGKRVWQATIAYNLALMAGWIIVFWDQPQPLWFLAAYLLPTGAALIAFERELQFEKACQDAATRQVEEEVEAADLGARDLVEL